MAPGPQPQRPAGEGFVHPPLGTLTGEAGGGVLHPEHDATVRRQQPHPGGRMARSGLV
jgi:hypothetical protein